jgi:hypothetical protein
MQVPATPHGTPPPAPCRGPFPIRKVLHGSKPGGPDPPDSSTCGARYGRSRVVLPVRGKVVLLPGRQGRTAWGGEGMAAACEGAGWWYYCLPRALSSAAGWVTGRCCGRGCAHYGPWFCNW